MMISYKSPKDNCGALTYHYEVNIKETLKWLSYRQPHLPNVSHAGLETAKVPVTAPRYVSAATESK